MSFGDDEELRALFAQEAAGQLDRLADGAIVLERGEAGPELIASIFRDAHTLKSSSALVGYEPISVVAHALEDVLGDLRAGRREPTPAVAEALLASADAMRAMVPALDAGQDTEHLARPALDAIARVAAEEPVAPPAPQGPPAPEHEPEPGPPDPEPEPPAPAAPAREEVVSVGLDRLDRLVRLSGEAIAAELRLRHLLGTFIGADPDAEAASVALARSLAALQEQTLRTRMTSLDPIAAPLRRAVRDVARTRGKDVEYRIEGERVELDRAVLDGLREPLLHLVRNAVDHGIEADVATRTGRGKPAHGTVTVRAERRGSEIRIEVEDDGGGLDLDALRAKAGRPGLDDVAAADLVFSPGLSTAGTVTDVSGRGVGMDVVRTAVEALRGRAEVRSQPGRGTSVVLTVPLTLAVLPCLLVEAGGERYAVPAHAAVSVVDDPREAEVGLEGRRALWVGGDIVTLSTLSAVLGAGEGRDGPAVVLDTGTGTRHAFRVTAVTGQRDVTVKELGGVLPRNPLVAGATIEPDGSVVLVLDPVALIDRAGTLRPGPAPAAPGPSASASATPVPQASHPVEVLVVDDALTVRELQRAILERAGYEVRVAVDGHDALQQLAERRPDCVISDVEMPRLDGFGLVEAIRADPTLASLPVMMVTSRAGEEDRRRGLEAGADAYLVKQQFDEAGLLAALGRLLGEGPPRP